MAPPWIAHADATPCVVPTAPSVDMLNELCELLSQGGASRNTDPDETPPFHILDILGGTSPQAVVRLPILSDPHALGSGLPSNGPAPPSTADAGATDHDALDLTIALLSAQLGENSTFSLPSIAGTGETGLIALGLLPTLPAAKYGDKPVLASPPSTVGTGATVHLTEVPLDSPPVARRTGRSAPVPSNRQAGSMPPSTAGRRARHQVSPALPLAQDPGQHKRSARCAVPPSSAGLGSTGDAPYGHLGRALTQHIGKNIRHDLTPLTPISMRNGPLRCVAPSPEVTGSTGQVVPPAIHGSVPVYVNATHAGPSSQKGKQWRRSYVKSKAYLVELGARYKIQGGSEQTNHRPTRAARRESIAS
ncbi:hypothetical protein AURDEDRAFT_178256 [Auricularia subglabra TFB-10046 SS5]|uniref:Uncharacterized protein n=1 Tax=Auricularia subglabra (strain TFB-10046 / SS5) TaxID=717982 RepID=J0WK32_AURST|nr:hypothetical protein AURDEDRAFT_178256 [Auricularia subglabra TFB-10046 SS5]